MDTVYSGKFQSTLPRGERQYAIASISCKLYISIHTPTRGATYKLALYQLVECISIHTPTRGATHITADSIATTKYFNPHSHEGSDWITCFYYQIVLLFQSTLPRGERLQNCTKAILTKVNIYAFLHTF